MVFQHQSHHIIFIPDHADKKVRKYNLIATAVLTPRSWPRLEKFSFFGLYQLILWLKSPQCQIILSFICLCLLFARIRISILKFLRHCWLLTHCSWKIYISRVRNFILKNNYFITNCFFIAYYEITTNQPICFDQTGERETHIVNINTKSTVKINDKQ